MWVVEELLGRGEHGCPWRADPGQGVLPDLDDVRAHVGEHRGGVRARQQPRQVEHALAGQEGPVRGSAVCIAGDFGALGRLGMLDAFGVFGWSTAMGCPLLE
jgi:hypothetical protein